MHMHVLDYTYITFKLELFVLPLGHSHVSAARPHHAERDPWYIRIAVALTSCSCKPNASACFPIIARSGAWDCCPIIHLNVQGFYIFLSLQASTCILYCCPKLFCETHILQNPRMPDCLDISVSIFTYIGQYI